VWQSGEGGCDSLVDVRVGVEVSGGLAKVRGGVAVVVSCLR